MLPVLESILAKVKNNKGINDSVVDYTLIKHSELQDDSMTESVLEPTYQLPVLEERDV